MAYFFLRQRLEFEAAAPLVITVLSPFFYQSSFMSLPVEVVLKREGVYKKKSIIPSRKMANKILTIETI